MQLAHNPYHKSTGVARQKRVFGNDKPETQTQEANAWKKGSEAYPYFVADDGLQMKPDRPGHGRMTEGPDDMAGVMAPEAPTPVGPRYVGSDQPFDVSQMKGSVAPMVSTDVAPRAGWREKLALAQRLGQEALQEKAAQEKPAPTQDEGGMCYDEGGDCYDEGGEPKEKWAQDATARMKEKGTVGSFTKQASSAGYSSPLEYARHVMAAPGEHSATTVKRANFAKNINK